MLYLTDGRVLETDSLTDIRAFPSGAVRIGDDGTLVYTSGHHQRQPGVRVYDEASGSLVQSVPTDMLFHQLAISKDGSVGWGLADDRVYLIPYR